MSNLSEEDIKIILSELSDCPFTEENINKIFSDKQQTNINIDCPKEDFSDKRDRQTKYIDLPTSKIIDILQKYKKPIEINMFLIKAYFIEFFGLVYWNYL
jgi:hypothetical protein